MNDRTYYRVNFLFVKQLQLRNFWMIFPLIIQPTQGNKENNSQKINYKIHSDTKPRFILIPAHPCIYRNNNPLPHSTFGVTRIQLQDLLTQPIYHHLSLHSQGSQWDYKSLVVMIPDRHNRSRPQNHISHKRKKYFHLCEVAICVNSNNKFSLKKTEQTEMQ